MAFTVVVAVLVVVVAAGAALLSGQGPRVTAVQVDPSAAATASGARVIFTTNQSLAEVSADQVTVAPAAQFTVDTSGRGVGVRFAIPLHDDTEYEVTIRDLQGASGGATSTAATSFRTPPAEVFVLQRSPDGDDAIFRTDLSGDRAVPVFTHEHIEDFRATNRYLVISTRGDAGAEVVVTDLEGGAARSLPLPGEGVPSNLQVSDRGDLVGYTWSDAVLNDTTGRESALFITSLNGTDAAAEPQQVDAGATDPRVAEFRFVPDSSAVLLLDFEGDLLLVDPVAGGDPAALGTALAIDDIARGSSLAYVERLDGLEVIDLADGTGSPLAPAAEDEAFGPARAVSAVPGGGTVRTYARPGADGLPDGQTVVFATDEGESATLLEVPGSDAVLQVCVAPSGRYAAVLVAPDLVSNAYDGYDLPLPERLETHVVEIDGAADVVALNGFAISWCRVPPR